MATGTATGTSDWDWLLLLAWFINNLEPRGGAGSSGDEWGKRSGMAATEVGEKNRRGMKGHEGKF